MIASNFKEFVQTASGAIKNALNETEIGQRLTQELLKEALRKNPNMTEAEWSEIKSQFMTFMFARLVTDHPELMEELGMHTYNELQTV